MVLFFRERAYKLPPFFCCNLIRMHKATAVLLMMFSHIQRVRTQSWRSKSSALAITIAGLLALSPCPAMFVVTSVVVVASAAVATVSVVVIVVDACFCFQHNPSLALDGGQLNVSMIKQYMFAYSSSRTFYCLLLEVLVKFFDNVGFTGHKIQWVIPTMMGLHKAVDVKAFLAFHAMHCAGLVTVL